MKKALFIIAALAVQFTAAAQVRDSIKVSILGDSYSTFQDQVDPESNAVWYYKSTNIHHQGKNDVGQLGHTWWYLVAKEMGYQIEKNNSYSGATISFSGYKKKGSHEDYSDRSFITRAYNLGHPDIIFVFGGTNDAWAGVPLGSYKWSKWTNEDLYKFRPALGKLLFEMKTLYPAAKIVYIHNCDLKDNFTKSVHQVCKHYKVDYVDLHDIEKQADHPSKAGMRAIATQIEQHMKQYYQFVK